MQDAARLAWGEQVPGSLRRWLSQVETLLRFCARRASGRPRGAHSGFQAVGVDAVTLRLVLAEDEVGALLLWPCWCQALALTLGLTVLPVEGRHISLLLAPFPHFPTKKVMCVA